MGAPTIQLEHTRWQDCPILPPFDHIITDPPFSARVHDGVRAERKDGTTGGLHENGFGYEPIGEAEIRELVTSLEPLCRGWFCVLTSHDLIPLFETCLGEAGRLVFAPVPCIQAGSNVRMAGDGPSNVTTFLVASRPRTKDAAAWGTLPGYYVAKRPERTGLMGTKSIELMMALVRDYSRPGDTILDPFAGSGTTLLAAREMGRNAIGCEVRREAYVVARKRLDQGYTPQMF